jgi:hypothetical protein
MTKTALIAACLAPMAAVGGGDNTVPTAEIASDSIRIRLYLPDSKTGFYRGTRFDWSGVIGSAEFAGHDYFPQWFQRADAKVRDFIYSGPDIVAGPCTAITGPSEEFSTDGSALGFAEAKPGGTFIKIGVGLLRKPDADKYDMFHLYEIVDGGKWTVRKDSTAIEFRHEISAPSLGYGYDYRKTVSVSQDKPQLVLEHRLRNTGQQPIRSSVYNHNFLYLDRRPPGPGTSITLPFPILAEPSLDTQLAEVQANQILFRKTLTGEDRVYTAISGFGHTSSDYDIRIENRQAGAGLRITGDRPLSRAALWSIRAPLSVEPFIDMNIAPGAEFTWRIQYDFYKLPASAH